MSAPRTDNPGPVLASLTLLAVLVAASLVSAPSAAQGNRDADSLEPDAAAIEQELQPLLNPLPSPAASTLGLMLEQLVTLPESKPSSGDVTDRRLMRHNRINNLTGLPDGSGRMAGPDLNGPLYLLDDDGRYVEYLNLNDHFPDIHNHTGLGTGFGFVAFHPEFGENGIFYTVHTESGAALREKPSDFPEFGSTLTQSVITQWVADDPSADHFTGTSAELMRIGFGGAIHTVQQIGFNPTADEGDADYGLLYLLVGDAGRGIGNDNPQDLATPHGRIFRIDPRGTDGRTGEYGIPADDPFVNVPGALPEIYAYGQRDPHRMSWDPADGHRMFVAVIGEWQVESIYEVLPGDNFGWSRREGPFRAENRRLYPLPRDDERFGYTYPVAAYDHDRAPGQVGDAGVAVGGGFVYRGKLDLLNGRYVFTDVPHGFVFATRAGQMQRGGKLATIERLNLYVDGRRTSFAELNADDGDDARIDLLDGAYTAGGDSWAVGDGDGPYFTSASDPAGIKIGGSFPQNSEERNPCNCRMDDLMFFDRVVTPAEIAMQYARMLGH